MSEKDKDLNAAPQEEKNIENMEAKPSAVAEGQGAENDIASEIMKTLQASKEAQEAKEALMNADSAEDESNTDAPSMPETSPDAAQDADVDHEEPTQPEAESKPEEDEEEGIDSKEYSGLSEEQIWEAVAELANVGDKQLDAAYKELKKAKEVISQHFEAQKTAAKEAFAAAGGDEAGFKFEASEPNKQFFALFNEVKDKRSEYYTKLTKEREGNLKRKQAILEEIKSRTEPDDISKVASRSNTESIKALQKEWQEIGAVPKTEADELYKSYRALLDMFYDKKRIAYDLQRLDREKNLKIKTGLCERAEDLAKEENLNEAVKQLNSLHDEYKAAGPVPREMQEELWQRFKKASDVVYDKKRAYAEEYKKQLQENMELKQALCLRAESYTSFESDSIKEWNQTTKELLALQEEWEKIGALPREVAKDINKQFWGNFKQFFANKNKFFEALDAAREENLKKKEELCEKAEAIQESNDWEEAANELKELQSAWKKIGPVPKKYKDSIYERFKKACDTFFDRRRNRRSEEEKVFVDNLKKKEEICQKIEELAKSPDNEAFEQLKKEFMEVGFVPKRAMNDITDKFSTAVENFFKGSDMDEHESDKATVSVLVEVFKEGAANDRNISRKRQALRNKINQIEDEIALLENNLTFFGKSKNAQKLIADFSTKIENAKERLEKLRRQYRIFSNMD